MSFIKGIAFSFVTNMNYVVRLLLELFLDVDFVLYCFYSMFFFFDFCRIWFENIFSHILCISLSSTNSPVFVYTKKRVKVWRQVKGDLFRKILFERLEGTWESVLLYWFWEDWIQEVGSSLNKVRVYGKWWECFVIASFSWVELFCCEFIGLRYRFMPFFFFWKNSFA